MARVNTIQEIIELDKLKPAIRKAQIEQRKREKKGHWVKVENGIQNLMKFVYD